MPSQTSAPSPLADTAAPHGRWWTRRRSWWELFLQFFAVLLGVVAATSVNAWREERAAQATVAHALQALANEVEINRAHLANRVAYYRTVIGELDAALAAKGSDASWADLPSMTGLNPPFLRRAAYEVSFHTGAFAQFDYATAERVAGTYELQSWALGLVDKTASVVIRSSEQGPQLRDLRRAFADWATMGDQLGNAYEALQRTLPAPESAAAAR